MCIVTTSLSYAQVDSSEFGTRFLPSKLIENEEAIIQVYATQGNFLVPKKINGLTVTSLDSSVIRVLQVLDSDSGFVSEVKVKASKAGKTKLFLAAPGFTPNELPVTIYGNKLNKEQFLVKAIPDTFSANGPFRGVLSVELADEDGFPIVASEDTAVSLRVSNNILDIFQKNLVIKEGEYFVGTQFTVKDPGKTIIYASGQDLDGQSNEIKVDEDENDRTLKLFVFPDEINISSERTVGHIIALLHEIDGDSINESSCTFTSSSSSSGCNVVLAKKDIQVTYKVTNSIFDDINTSTDAEIGERTGVFTIKKGTYWGHTTFDLIGGSRGSFEGTYDVTITSGDPISLDTEEVQAVFDQDNRQEGDRFVKLDTIPIFATGNKELIGVVHLEDEDDYPINAEENLDIRIDSSDKKFVSVDPVTIKAGSGSALVFGTVGNTIPEDNNGEVELNAAVEVNDSDPQFVEALMFGSKEDSLELMAEPLVTQILTGTEFPIVVYLTDGDGITKFPNSANLFVSPSEKFEVQSKQILRGNDLIMLDSKAIEKGSDTLKFSFNEHEETITITNLSVKPANIHLDYSDTILAGINDIFSIQLVNSAGLPVFATEDVPITLIPQDESLIQVPHTVTIKKGDYFTLFDAAPKKTGFTEISALSEGLPLRSYDIEIKDLIPRIEITVPEIIEAGEAFVASIEVTQDNFPLKNLSVKWNIVGGSAQAADSKTGPTGEALASIFSTDNQRVQVEAVVSGPFYPTSKITRTVQVNSTSEFLAFAEEGQGVQNFEKFEIGGVDPIIIIVPAAIGIVGYMMRRQGSLKIRNPSPQIKAE